ncbi:MAG: ABC transporter ATP-binding protein [Thermodesulfobacteriota bacterium]
MWGDYGYIEDDRRQAYDFKLLGRLAGYTRPYLGLLTLTSFLILASTAADLVLPYLTKAALDRHIVVSAQMVVFDPQADQALADLFEKSRPLFEPSGRADVFFLPGEKARRLDPADLNRLKAAGLIRPGTFYLVPASPGPAWEIVEKRPDLFQVYPRLAAIPIPDLGRLERTDLMKLRGGDAAGLAWIALFCCLVLAVGYLFDFVHNILLEYTGQRVTHDLRQRVMAHVLNQSLAFHDHNTTGRLVARVTNDIQNLGEMIKSVAVTFFKDAFILAGIIAILLTLNFRLALVTFALLPPIFMISMVFRRLARDVFRVLRAKVAEINSFFSETIAGVRVIQAFRREETNAGQFDRLNHEYYLAGVRQVKVFALFMPVVDLMASTALALIIWYGGLGVLSETMTLGAVAAFIGYTRMFFQPIRDLAEKFNILQSAMASLERIFSLLDVKAALPAAKTIQALPPAKGAIVFDKVSFAYEPGAPVLKGLSFTIAPGQTLAIVGATGAGKTSIINLLLRFYDVTSGRISVDGADVRDLPLEDHRRRIGLVMQDVFLFDGTVRENIALARDGIPREKIEAAAAAVGADDFIQALPEGYEQRLGEGGRSLSLGQRQLLSFARTLVQDPQILVLDEATAHVDSETEKLIEAALARLTSGRTSIMIAHRLSTIQRADRILVLHQGRAVEQGGHAELLARQGPYYRLLMLQQGGRLGKG